MKSRMKASKIPRRPPRRKPPRPGQPPGNTSTPPKAPPAPDLPTRDSSRKSFEREPNRLQNFIQWWWHTRLDSNDRDGLYFLGMMVGAPLFLMVVATGGNILLVSLQMVWAVWLLVVGYRSLRQAITELVDEYQDSIDNPSVQNDDVDRERGTSHTIGR